MHRVVASIRGNAPTYYIIIRGDDHASIYGVIQKLGKAPEFRPVARGGSAMATGLELKSIS